MSSYEPGPQIIEFNATADERQVFTRLEKRHKELQPFHGLAQLMAAPHPVRLAASPLAGPDAVILTCCEPRNRDQVLALIRAGVGTIGVYETLDSLGDRRLHNFLASYQSASSAHGGFGGGAAGAMMQALRQRTIQAPLYSLGDDLVDILDATDLGSDIPLEELQLPAPDLFIQLGIDRARAKHFLHNSQSGLHALEGAYVSRVADQAGRPFIEITLTGSPVGKSDLLDDAVEWASLEVHSGVTITEAIERAFTRSLSSVDPMESAMRQVEVRAHAESLRAMHELVVKAILFLGMPEAQMQPSDAGARARQALARAVSGAHRRKALKAASFSYDCIHVDAPQVLNALEPASGGVHRAGHLRRGHFRHQRHGPGLSLTKVKWIWPMLIGPTTVESSG